MEHNIPINELVDIDLPGYLEGENDPECVTEIFDLQGKKVE